MHFCQPVLAALAGTPLRAAETSQTIAFRGCDATLAGAVDLRLRLFDAAAGGNQVFEETQAGLPADAAGCVSVRLGDVAPLAANLFTTYPSLWVAFGLDVDPDTELGGGRTAVTANGYTFRAAVADNAQTISPGATIAGDSPTAVLSLNNTNLNGPALSATGGHTGVSGSGGQFGLSGTSSNSSSSAAGVLGEATSPSGNTTGVWGRTVSSSDGARGVFGEATAATGGASGVVGTTRTVSGSSGAAGVLGVAQASGFSDTATGVHGITNSGSGRGMSGLNDHRTGPTLGIVGEIRSNHGGARGVWGLANTPTGSGAGVHGQTLSSSNGARGVFGEATAATGAASGVTGSTNSRSIGAVGVLGVANASGLTDGAHGVVATTNSGRGRGLSALNNHPSGPTIGIVGEIVSFNNDARGVWGVANTTTGGGAGVLGQTFSPFGTGGTFINSGGGDILRGLDRNGVQVFRLAQNGTLTTRVVEITGADFSEKFEVREAKGRIEPGMVVAIDPAHPGQLVVSAQAYDRRVAGILSGAGGINTGMLMGQPGTLADGNHPVALSGRVYVWADASNGAIQPGDLLTTSNLPGHAMKVMNYTKAQGAILGKAMTGLAKGRGLVLVLVTLQ